MWSVARMTNTRFGTPWIVVNPACPPGRHPTRGGACGCRVFKDEGHARSYATERDELAAAMTDRIT